MSRIYIDDKWDDETSELLYKKRLNKHYKISKEYEKFSIKDAFAFGSHIGSCSYGISKKQYNANVDNDLINIYKEKTNGE